MFWGIKVTRKDLQPQWMSNQFGVIHYPDPAVAEAHKVQIEDFEREFKQYPGSVFEVKPFGDDNVRS